MICKEDAHINSSKVALCGPAILLLLAVAGCGTVPSKHGTLVGGIEPTPCVSAEDCTAKADEAARFLLEAHQWAQRATRSRSEGATIKYWSNCAATAYRALGTTQVALGEQAAALATQCTDEFLKLALQSSSRRWSEGLTQIGNLSLAVEFRGLSPYLVVRWPLPGRRCLVRFVGDTRYINPGFGVPLAVMTPRCDDRPLCNLLPPEGVFRWATAWSRQTPRATLQCRGW